MNDFKTLYHFHSILSIPKQYENMYLLLFNLEIPVRFSNSISQNVFNKKYHDLALNMNNAETAYISKLVNWLRST